MHGRGRSNKNQQEIAERSILGCYWGKRTQKLVTFFGMGEGACRSKAYISTYVSNDVVQQLTNIYLFKKSNVILTLKLAFLQLKSFHLEKNIQTPIWIDCSKNNSITKKATECYKPGLKIEQEVILDVRLRNWAYLNPTIGVNKLFSLNGIWIRISW